LDLRIKPKGVIDLRDESVYHKYANWKMDNHDLLKYLVDNDSDLIMRSRHVLDVVDYLYDKLIDDVDYSDDEDNIFQTGFYYLIEQIEEIKKLMEKSYQNDIRYLEKRSKDVNLLLNAIDFHYEVLNAKDYKKEDSDKLLVFIIDVTKHLEDKEDVPKFMFKKLDKITFELYNRLNVREYPINSIFLEIADELGIL